MMSGVMMRKQWCLVWTKMTTPYLKEMRENQGREGENLQI